MSATSSSFSMSGSCARNARFSRPGGNFGARWTCGNCARRAHDARTKVSQAVVGLGLPSSPFIPCLVPRIDHPSSSVVESHREASRLAECPAKSTLCACEPVPAGAGRRQRQMTMGGGEYKHTLSRMVRPLPCFLGATAFHNMNDWIELGSAIADGRGLRRAAYSSVCRRPDLELNEATI